MFENWIHVCKWQPPLPAKMWVNSLQPSDTIWCHRIWSALVRAMVCCLAAPSHTWNQSWLIICKVLWHSPRGNLVKNAHIYPWFGFENYWLKITVTSPRGQWVNSNLNSHVTYIYIQHYQQYILTSYNYKQIQTVYDISRLQTTHWLLIVCVFMTSYRALI